jgi:hypothetical protein
MRPRILFLWLFLAAILLLPGIQFARLALPQLFTLNRIQHLFPLAACLILHLAPMQALLFAWERRRARPIAAAGIACVAVAFCMWLILALRAVQEEASLLQVVPTVGAIFCTAWCVLALGGTRRLLNRILRGLALVAIAITGATGIVMNYISEHSDHEDPEKAIFMIVPFTLIFGAIGVAASLAALIHGRTSAELDVAPPAPFEATCPRCGLRQSLLTGDSRCAVCRLRISLKVPA